VQFLNLLVLQQYTDAPVNRNIFWSRYESRYYDKISHYYDIVIHVIWKNSTFRNNCLLWLLTQVQALSELFKGTWEREKEFHLCIALCASSHVSFKMAAQNHAQFQLIVSWHTLAHPRTKHMVHPFFAALLCLSVVYHRCITSCIVSWYLYQDMCHIVREIVLLQSHNLLEMHPQYSTCSKHTIKHALISHTLLAKCYQVHLQLPNSATITTNDMYKDGCRAITFNLAGQESPLFMY